MQDDKGPLLYINSVTTEAIANNQNVYDTRNPRQKTEKFKDLKKLKNIIEMFAKNRPVLCKLITKDGEIKATPYKIVGNQILLKTAEGKEETIDINLLETIEIIRF